MPIVLCSGRRSQNNALRFSCTSKTTPSILSYVPRRHFLPENDCREYGEWKHGKAVESAMKKSKSANRKDLVPNI